MFILVKYPVTGHHFRARNCQGGCSVSVTIQAPQFRASTIVLLMVATVACFYRCHRPRRCYGCVGKYKLHCRPFVVDFWRTYYAAQCVTRRNLLGGCPNYWAPHCRTLISILTTETSSYLSPLRYR